MVPYTQTWHIPKTRKEIRGCQRVGREEGGMTSDFLVNKGFFGGNKNVLN